MGQGLCRHAAEHAVDHTAAPSQGALSNDAVPFHAGTPGSPIVNSQLQEGAGDSCSRRCSSASSPSPKPSLLIANAESSRKRFAALALHCACFALPFHLMSGPAPLALKAALPPRRRNSTPRPLLPRTICHTMFWLLLSQRSLGHGAAERLHAAARAGGRLPKTAAAQTGKVGPVVGRAAALVHQTLDQDLALLHQTLLAPEPLNLLVVACGQAGRRRARQPAASARAAPPGRGLPAGPDPWCLLARSQPCCPCASPSTTMSVVRSSSEVTIFTRNSSVL